MKRTKLYFVCSLFFILGIAFGAFGYEYILDKYNIASSEALLKLASDYLDEGNHESALGSAYASAYKAPDNYSGYMILGDIYSSMENHTAALKYYKEAVDKLRSGSTEFHTMKMNKNQLSNEEKLIMEKIKAAEGSISH